MKTIILSVLSVFVFNLSLNAANPGIMFDSFKFRGEQASDLFGVLKKAQARTDLDLGGLEFVSDAKTVEVFNKTIEIESIEYKWKDADGKKGDIVVKCQNPDKKSPFVDSSCEFPYSPWSSLQSGKLTIHQVQAGLLFDLANETDLSTIKWNELFDNDESFSFRMGKITFTCLEPDMDPFTYEIINNSCCRAVITIEE